MTVDAAVVARNIAAVQARIARAGGDGRVQLVAVTKGFGADAVRAAADAGVLDIGENYVAELCEKHDALQGVPVRWHLIGHVQRNKVRRVAPLVHLWHTVDRAELGAEIAQRAPGARVLVQVNASGEAQKSGCAPDDAPALVEALRGRGLDVAGLMTIGSIGDPARTRTAFRRLSMLAAALALRELSMGMSDDLEIAVEEGATMVRIGRSLFGERSPGG
jgi:pyridoxal phosphate enzyme (YggS family)